MSSFYRGSKSATTATTPLSGGDHPWYEAMQAAGGHDAGAADKALAHAGTPTTTYVDALGRPFPVIEHNLVGGSTEHHETRTELDIKGHVLSVTDAHGRTCMSYTYGMLGQVLKLDSLDAVRRWCFDAGSGQPLRMWGERQGAPGEPYTQRLVYDALRRPTEVWVDDGGVDKLVRSMSYGREPPANRKVKVDE